MSDSNKSVKKENYTPFSEIWKTLSTLDLKGKIEKKMNLNYLSWANAWDVIMNHYPNSTFEPLPDVRLENGTVEVWCAATVEGHTRKMWLPVMNHKNMAIQNPTSRDISDARMRCLVKCLAMFGLGLYLYQGEDVPTNRAEPEHKPQNQHKPAASPQDVIGAVKKVSEAKTLDELKAVVNASLKGQDKDSGFYKAVVKAASTRKTALTPQEETA